MKIVAPAKINLALHVTGQRPDGYHLIETLVTFASVGDVVSIEAAAQDRLTFSGPFGRVLAADFGTNLIIKAIGALREAAQGRRCPPVAVHLEKNLPIASGIGGGSADAAAALKGLNDHWGLGFDEAALMRVGLRLGADVPMCIYGRPLIANGIGDDIKPVGELPELPMVLVNPQVGVSTAAIFKALLTKENGGLPSIFPLAGEMSTKLTEGGAQPAKSHPSSGAACHHLPTEDVGRRKIPALLDYLNATRNDLEAPAREICPVIDDVLSSLAASGALFARMSGSGATCFGIYPDADSAEEAKMLIVKQYPDWWVA